MNNKLKVSAISLTAALCFVLSACDVNDIQEQEIAQPGESTKSESINFQIMVQRATQAAIWAMPAVSIWDITVSTRRDLGGDVGDIVYFTKPMNARHGFLTANDVTPYVIASLTTKDGPLVVEVPPATDKASYFGTFVDAWQAPIADVGPPGADEGKGGKYLFLPPGYEGDVPDGYLVYHPDTYSVNFAFRPVSSNGGTLDEVVAYGLTLKTYKLSEAKSPPKTRFIDAYPETWNTLPVYDISYFNDLNAVIQNEPVLDRDKAMMALLATLGIEKGKPFKPDAATTRALEEGLKQAYAYLQSRLTTPGQAVAPYWDNTQWGVFNLSPEQAKIGFPFVTEDRLLIDERAQYYFYATYLPKVLGGGSFYLVGLRVKMDS